MQPSSEGAQSGWQNNSAGSADSAKASRCVREVLQKLRYQREASPLRPPIRPSALPPFHPSTHPPIHPSTLPPFHPSILPLQAGANLRNLRFSLLDFRTNESRVRCLVQIEY